MTLCTIYNGAFEDPDYAARARVALMIFNDAILRMAFEHHLSVLDLRHWCAARGQTMRNPIEPSGQGGLKIAQAIAGVTGAGPLGRHSACFA